MKSCINKDACTYFTKKTIGKDFTWDKFEKYIPMFNDYLQIIMNGKNVEITCEDYYNEHNATGTVKEELKHINNLIEHLSEDENSFYVRYRTSKIGEVLPVSCALFSTRDNYPKSRILEMVYTRENMRGNRYAQKLLDYCFEDLNLKDKVNFIISHVEDANDSSINLHSHLDYFNVFDTDNGVLNYQIIINPELSKILEKVREVEGETVAKRIVQVCAEGDINTIKKLLQSYLDKEQENFKGKTKEKFKGKTKERNEEGKEMLNS